MLAQNDDVTPVFTFVRNERNEHNTGCNYVNVHVEQNTKHISTMENDPGLENDKFYDAMDYEIDSAYDTNSVVSYSSTDTDTEKEYYANVAANDFSSKGKHIEKGKRLKFWRQNYTKQIEILKKENEDNILEKRNLKKEIEKSKEIIKQKNEKIFLEQRKIETSLKDKIKLESDLENTKCVLNNFTSERILMENEISRAKNKTWEEQKENKKLKLDLQQMKSGKNEAMAKHVEELAKMQSQLLRNKEYIKEINEEKLEIEQELLQKIKKEQEEKKSLEEDWKMLDYSLDLANKSNKKLLNSVKQQLKNIEELEKTYEILQEKEESNRNSLCNLVKENENLKNQIPKIKDLEKKLKKSTENFEMIQDKLFQTQNNEILDNQNNKKKQHMLNSQGQKLGKTLRFIKHFKKEQEELITTKDCEYFNLENKNRNLQHELISSSNKYNSLKRNIISMEQRLINEVQAKAFLQQKLVTAENDLKSSKNLNNIKEVAYGNLRNENSNLKIKLNAQNQKFENKLKELKDLDKYSADIDKDIFKLFDFMNNFENKTCTNEADLHNFYEYMKYWKTHFQREDHYVPNEISDEENEENEESCENEKLQKEINTIEKCWNNTKFRSPLYQELRVEIEIKKEKLRDPFWQLETEESREKNENILRKRLRKELDLEVPTKTHEILESLV